jgi:NAD(P)-dependent dehydrogenase (short-subunit alcohol dehydrogenase family)
MSGSLEGRVALVTGAAQGIGRAVAIRLAADGARVAVNDLVETAALTGLAREIGGITAPADVSDHAAVTGALARVREELGAPVDILVANAARETMGDFLEQDDDALFGQVDVNLTGTYSLISAVLPQMREAGRGSIVIFSSIWGITGAARAVGYSASKAGLNPLTKALARELSADGIRVNALAPGPIDSPQIEVDAADAGMTLDELRAYYASRTANGRVGQPEEIASLVSFLSGDAGRAFTGQVVQPNGGSEMGWA